MIVPELRHLEFGVGAGDYVRCASGVHSKSPVYSLL